MKLIYAVLVALLPFCSTHSREYRKRHLRVPIDTQEQFDTVISWGQSNRAQDNISIDRKEFIKETADEIYAIYDDKLQLSASAQEPLWLSFSASERLVQRYSDSKAEVYHLLRGNIKPRASCAALPASVKECVFSSLVSDYRIYPPIPLSHLNTEQWNYIFDFSDDLFNNQLYDHAEAWSFFLLVNLLRRYGDGNPTAKLWSLDQDRLLLRGGFVLSEIARLKGDLNASISHSLRNIYSYEALSSDASSLPNYGVIAKLRLLLAIPPIPSDYNISQKYRHEMVEDLHIFAESVKHTNSTLSLNDLSMHISATPFNMAHQGLNDLDFQTALAKVFSALCPDLHYISPHLQEHEHLHKQHLQHHNITNYTRAADIDDDSDDSGDNLSSEGRVRSLSSVTESEGSESADVEGSADRIRVIKVGFVSTFLLDHSIGRILVELLIYLNQQAVQRGEYQYALDVYAYNIDRRIHRDTPILINGTHADFANPDSITPRDDVITRALQHFLGAKYVRIPENMNVAREVISAAELDVLVYTDVGMELCTYLLAFSKLARYQVAWWGHPITTALSSVDYFISLVDEVDGADEHYSEQLVRMEHINTVPLSPPSHYRIKRKLFERESSGNNAGSNGFAAAEALELLKEAESDEKTLLSLGLTMESDYCMILGRLFKLHPEFDDMLVSLILRLYSDSLNITPHNRVRPSIVFIAEGFHTLNNLIFERLLSALTGRLQRMNVIRQGSEAVTDLSKEEAEEVATQLLTQYVKVVGLEHYYPLLRNARAVLDTFPYGGCLTSHDALSHSVPLVTLPPPFIRGRFTLGLYREMKIGELVANDSVHYVNIVTKLLTNEEYWFSQAYEIHLKFATFARSNNFKVAQEWAQFIALVAL